MSWQEAGEFLAGIRAMCRMSDLSVQVHDVGRAPGERYRFPVCDAMIVTAALVSGCDRLQSEDMHHGLLVGSRLRIVNPF